MYIPEPRLSTRIVNIYMRVLDNNDLFRRSTEHGHTMVATSALKMQIMFEIAQAMPLWNFPHRFFHLKI